jgi:hypothetical protein
MPVTVTSSAPRATFTSFSIFANRGRFSPRKLPTSIRSPASFSWMGKWLYTTFIRYWYPSVTPLHMFCRWAAKVPQIARIFFRPDSVAMVISLSATERETFG